MAKPVGKAPPKVPPQRAHAAQPKGKAGKPPKVVITLTGPTPQRVRADHAILRAKGGLGMRPVSRQLPLVHPKPNKIGQIHEQVFLSTAGGGVKVRVFGEKQPFKFMDYIQAGKPKEAMRAQLLPGESLVRVGNDFFVLKDVSRAVAQSFGGEVLAEG